jgi:hypothetical protein
VGDRCLLVLTGSQLWHQRDSEKAASLPFGVNSLLHSRRAPVCQILLHQRFYPRLKVFQQPLAPIVKYVGDPQARPILLMLVTQLRS